MPKEIVEIHPPYIENAELPEPDPDSPVSQYLYGAIDSRRIAYYEKLQVSHLEFIPLESVGTEDQIVATINATAEGITISAGKTAITGQVNTNVSAISVNASGIALNVSDIAGNTSNITINAGNISANVSDIAGNTSNITINASGISTNVTNIAGNVTDITQNATDISLNATDIAGNTASIVVNASNIALRVEKNDVINQINISTEGITIDADNITIAGSTTFISEASALGVPKVFYATPTTPYRVGDLWAGGSAGDLKKCITERLTGAYNAADWDLASKYTDDSGVTTIIGNTVTTGYVNALSITAQYVVASISITSPTITGGTIQTATGNVKKIVISGNEFKAYDASGNLRIHTDAEYMKWLDNNEAEAARTYGWKTGDSYVFTIYVADGATYPCELELYGGPSASYINTNCDLNVGGDIAVTGTVDGIDIAAHAGNASAHHSSTSDGLVITPAYVYVNYPSGGARLVVGGNVHIQSGSLDFKTTALSIASLGNVVFFATGADLVFGGSGDGRNIRPYADNNATCGSTDQRWSDVRTVLLNGADIGFEHQWWMTESYKVGIKEEGIAVLNPKNELVFFIGETGLYVKGGQVKNLDLLPYIKTTLEQRSRMDRFLSQRKKDKSSPLPLMLPDFKAAEIGGGHYVSKLIKN